jgi:hypothetical protein
MITVAPRSLWRPAGPAAPLNSVTSAPLRLRVESGTVRSADRYDHGDANAANTSVLRWPFEARSITHLHPRFAARGARVSADRHVIRIV